MKELFNLIEEKALTEYKEALESSKIFGTTKDYKKYLEHKEMDSGICWFLVRNYNHPNKQNIFTEISKYTKKGPLVYIHEPPYMCETIEDIEDSLKARIDLINIILEDKRDNS